MDLGSMTDEEIIAYWFALIDEIPAGTRTPLARHSWESEADRDARAAAEEADWAVNGVVVPGLGGRY